MGSLWSASGVAAVGLLIPMATAARDVMVVALLAAVVEAEFELVIVADCADE